MWAFAAVALPLLWGIAVEALFARLRSDKRQSRQDSLLEPGHHDWVI